MKKSLFLSFVLLFLGMVILSNVTWGEDQGTQTAPASSKADQKKSNDNDWEPDWDNESGNKAKDSSPKGASLQTSAKSPAAAKPTAVKTDSDKAATGKTDGTKAAAGKTDNGSRKVSVPASPKAEQAVPAATVPLGKNSPDTALNSLPGQSSVSAPVNAPVAVCPIESVIPGKAIAVVKISSLQEFNIKGKEVLNDLEVSTFAPLDWLKYTPFGKAINNTVQDSPVALAVVPNGKGLGHILFFPVKNYVAFAAALGARKAALSAKEEPGVLPAETCVNITLPKGYFICGYQGYALLISENLKGSLSQLYDRGTLAESRKARRSLLKNALLSFEAYPEGIRQIAQLRQNGLMGFSLDINKWIESANQSFEGKEKIKVNPKMVKRWNNFLDRTEKNLRYFRMDLDVQDDALLTAITGIPADGTPMMAQIEDKSIADIPLYFTADQFTKIVPNYSAPISGQIDLSPTASAALESPYNQIRHVEYSLILPGEKDFLAQNWCIFLEVDDAKQFVHEIVVPKAQFIGGYTGAEMGSELAGRIFGNMAVRRQNRGRPADPESAAANGSSLGARLGERLGQMMGEKEATTIFDFEGFPLYVADTEFYTRKMAEINAKKAGQIPEKPIMLNGEYTLINTVLGVLGGQNSELTSLLNRSAVQNNNNNGQSPNLIAKKSFFLVLDDHHLLVVPGNRDLLREAKNNWLKMLDDMKKGKVQEPLRSAQAPREAWSILWEIMNREIVNAAGQQIRSITRFDPPSIKYLANYLNTFYLKNAPLKFNSIPNEAPEALFFTTTSQRSFHAYYAAPLKTVSALVAVIKENNKNNDKESTK